MHGVNSLWIGIGLFVLAVALSAQEPAVLPSRLEPEQQANAADTVACVRLAVQYWWGIERAANAEKALQWSSRCAGSDPLAAFVYAECLADPSAVMIPDLRRADSILTAIFPQLQLRAIGGDGSAMVALSEYYRRGLGNTVPNDDSAAALLQRALEAKNPVAAFLLIRDTPYHDENRRRVLLRHAADGGVVAAMVEWARLLLADTPHVADAIAMLRDAEQRGSADAALLLGVCAQRGVGVERNPTHALRWIAVAADRGNITAQLELSVRLLYGIGFAADTLAALDWALRALSMASQHHREAVLDYLIRTRDSLPQVFGHLEAAVLSFAQRSSGYDSTKWIQQLTGSGVRLWQVLWCPSVEAPAMVALRRDGRALVLTRRELRIIDWRLRNAYLFLRGDDREDTVQVVALTNGWCALRWKQTFMLYVPVTSQRRRQDTLLGYHPFFRPHIAMLSPRVGEQSVRLRINATNIPRSGLVLFPLGIATDRTARTAQRAVGVTRLWRVWDDGSAELVWEPRQEDFPEPPLGKCVLFVQCSWQFEGDEETMIVKSPPFELPFRRLRR